MVFLIFKHHTRKKMPLVTFVILHYLTIDTTINCINSLKNKLNYQNYQIVVVDNGSPNGSGDDLASMYKDDASIDIICLQTNLGFSAGNNVGYIYAKENYKSEYIILINNDTEIIQEDFVQKIIQCYKKHLYYVLGPDVINMDGVHQSPIRNHIITRSEAKKRFVKKYMLSKYFRIHKLLNLSENTFIFRKYNKPVNSTNRMYVGLQENVELLGACLIFSPSYIKENDFAFEELTFMYYEEALLAIRCNQKSWKILYNPDLQILHVESTSTKAAYTNRIDKEIFYTDCCVQAIKEVIKKLK